MKQLDDTVGKLGDFDLTEAKGRIDTALAAGRAEVRLNYAQLRSKMSTREYDTHMLKNLKAAKTETEVQ